jgi:hypothetical protein
MVCSIHTYANLGLFVDIEVSLLTIISNLIQDVNHYNKLEDPTDEENDMLDLAFGLTET